MKYLIFLEEITDFCEEGCLGLFVFRILAEQSKNLVISIGHVIEMSFEIDGFVSSVWHDRNNNSEDTILRMELLRFT